MKLLPARTSRTHPGQFPGVLVEVVTAARGDAALEDGTTGGAEEHHGMLGVGVQGLSDHHAGLGPDACVLDAGHAGHDLPVTGELLIDEVELIGGSPDVGAGRFDRESPTRRARAAHQSNRTNVLVGPETETAAHADRDRGRGSFRSLIVGRNGSQAVGPGAERWTMCSCREQSRKSPGACFPNRSPP